MNWLESAEFTGGAIVTTSIIGASTISQNFFVNNYPGGGQFWYGWDPQSMSFVADSTTLTIRFQGNDEDANGNTLYEPGIDAVSITAGTSAVPEPASMFLLGTGVAGLVARRRRIARSGR